MRKVLLKYGMGQVSCVLQMKKYSMLKKTVEAIKACFSACF